MKDLTGKKIGILGLGISGISSFEFLKPIAKEIICWDDRNPEKLDDEFMIPLSDKRWQELDVIIISPGIPNSHDIFSLAHKHNILISSDIETFLNNNSNSKIIAITGTNGKSTTTSLIHHILSKNDMDYHMGGNIGKSVLSLPQHKEGYVIELSSFQLDLLQELNPDISVLLNITPDHTDRYSTNTEYCDSKKRILSKDGINIIGTSGKDSCNIYENLRSEGEKRLIPIGKKYKNLSFRKSEASICEDYTESQEIGISCTSNLLVDNFFDKISYDIEPVKSLIGTHNQENIAASFAVCRSVGIMGKDIIKHLKTFQGLKHRMQFLGSRQNIHFYNDSKATNTDAAAASLSSLDNVLWLAGGVFKEKDLSALDDAIKNIRKAYLFGKSKQLFADYLQNNNVEYEVHDTMEDAFYASINELKEELQYNILLAPACSSFDQFRNFEERGDSFIEFYKKSITMQ